MSKQTVNRSERRATATPVPSAMSRRTAINPAPVYELPPLVQEVLRSPGRSLDAGARAFMESRFDRDFSSVRVHADHQAADSAQAINGRAYTVGHDVVFGAGQYAPTSEAGWGLIAHELTHVVQQSGTTTNGLVPVAGHDAHEREAKQMAATIMAGKTATVHSAVSTPVIQRQESDLPPIPHYQLTPPSLIQPRTPRFSLFPPGKEPHFRLNLLGDDLLRQLLQMQGVRGLRPAINLRPATPSNPPSQRPNFTPAPSPNPSPAATWTSPNYEPPDPLWSWEMKLEVDPQSQLGRFLTRFGLPLESQGQQAATRFEQTVATVTGREAADTPLAVQLAATAINLAATLPAISNARDRIAHPFHLESITVVADPSNGLYGLSVSGRF